MADCFPVKFHSLHAHVTCTRSIKHTTCCFYDSLFSISLSSESLSSRKDQNSISSSGLQAVTKSNYSDEYSSDPAQSSSLPSNNAEDDFDDFDPRGTSTTSKLV